MGCRPSGRGEGPGSRGRPSRGALSSAASHAPCVSFQTSSSSLPWEAGRAPPSCPSRAAHCAWVRREHRGLGYVVPSSALRRRTPHSPHPVPSEVRTPAVGESGPLPSPPASGRVSPCRAGRIPFRAGEGQLRTWRSPSPWGPASAALRRPSGCGDVSHHPRLRRREAGQRGRRP